MPTFEFAVAVRDEDDLASGHKRKKAGDFIAYKPHPWNWGRKEVKSHLILTIDGLTEEQARRMCSPYYMTGKYADEIDPIMDAKTPEEKLALIPIAKRRHNIDFATLKSKFAEVDLNKVADVDLDYQPMKETTIDGTVEVIVNDKYTETTIKPVEIPKITLSAVEK